MPGTDDRTPADADRPPASRVGAELQDLAEGAEDATPEEAADIEARAMANAKEKMWDQPQTAREGRAAGE